MTRELEVACLDVDAADVRAELAAFLAAAPRSVVQQTVVWGDVIRRVGPDEPYVLGARARGELVGVLPAYRFAGPYGAILTSVPQVGPLGGVVLGEGARSVAACAPLLDAFLDTAARTGCAVATVVTSPFWPDAEQYRGWRMPDFELTNVCQVLDLESALDAPGDVRDPSPHLRRNLRRAQSGALVLDEAQTSANVAQWYEIHRARHREIGAVPLPRALFDACLEVAVPADKARFFFARCAASGAMAGGGLYVHHGQVIDALMPSVATEYAELRTSYFLALESMRWAHRRRIRFYNWQGSPPGGGVHRFKQQWGSTERPYSFLTWVTGDLDALRAATVADVRRAYPWHYVLPFDQLVRGITRGAAPSSRRSAWQAGEGARG